jgi:anti-sigma regulatory factor (Ser/Thr protein kinase)
VSAARTAGGVWPPARRTLRVPADLAALAPVRRVLADALERRGWGRDDVWRVLLVVQEALVNAVEHGSTSGDLVEVRLSIGRDRARVRLRDRGRPGTPSPSGPVVVPPAGQTHGRGRLIMAALADAVDSRPSGPGTRVSLAFRRRATPRPADRPVLRPKVAVAPTYRDQPLRTC